MRRLTETSNSCSNVPLRSRRHHLWHVEIIDTARIEGSAHLRIVHIGSQSVEQNNADCNEKDLLSTRLTDASKSLSVKDRGDVYDATNPQHKRGGGSARYSSAQKKTADPPLTAEDILGRCYDIYRVYSS